MNFSKQDIWLCKDLESPYSKKVAYFSMEFGVHQSLKTYSGGLGYLAGSHMRSAHDLRQNVIGISLLWKHGYYSQSRNSDRTMRAEFLTNQFSFLQDTGIKLTVNVHEHDIVLKVWLLKPETFGTAPIFYLSADVDENDFISRTTTHRLYDANTAAKIAQSILLGVGGAKLIEILGDEVEVYHMNEGHAVPLVFHLYNKWKSVEEVQKRVVFTTHTPEMAGNEEHALGLLHEMNFFQYLPLDEVKHIAKISKDSLNYTLTALRFSRIANGVSQMHGKVANQMWKENEGVCPITSITNAQHKKSWVDCPLEKAFEKTDLEALIKRKKELKKELFEIVADQEGKLFDPNILTIVWARRFAGYKRPHLLLQDWERFQKFIARHDNPVQIIWAGKPYPEDRDGVEVFNFIQEKIKNLSRCAILVGYELGLSAKLKKGADVWLNNPRVTREASGTSGMTAAMNGAINVSIPDGWVPEFAKHGHNGFYVKESDPSWPIERQDKEDFHHLFEMLESEVIPTYYDKPLHWAQMMMNGMRDVYPMFDSDRMAKEYYEKMYNN